MPIIHERIFTGSHDTMDFSTIARSEDVIKLYKDDPDNIFRFGITLWSFFFPNGSQNEISQYAEELKNISTAKIQGLLPNGETFEINNLSRINRETVFDNYRTFSVPWDSRFNSQIGTGKYILIFGTPSNSNFAYVRFNIEVSDPALIPTHREFHKLLMSPSEPPLRIHLSQYDTDFLLDFFLYASQGKSSYSLSQASSAYGIPFLWGKRPDGEEVIIQCQTKWPGAFGSQIDYAVLDENEALGISRTLYISLDGRQNGLGAFLTEVPGEYEVCFQFMDVMYRPYGASAHYVPYYATQRIRFIIEPIE